MIITYYGKQFFKVQFGETIIAFNPIGKDSKLPQARFGAGIAIISLNHPDFNGVENVTYGDKKPFIIDGPGEYEVNDIFIKGFYTESSYGKETKGNTIYQIGLEGMNLCFLGNLTNIDLPPKIKEDLDDIDILFVPVGDDTLPPRDANKIANKFEAKLIIPMDYDKASLKAFLEEAGVSAHPVEKLTLKKKDLDGKGGEVGLLTPQS